MKIVVMIPAFNEEACITSVIKSIPKEVDGNPIFISVVDDGSVDSTLGVARNAGAHYTCAHSKNMGVAQAFKTGLSQALDAGADVIVNIDADGQFDPAEIPTLVTPILTGQADMVLGSRFVDDSSNNMPIVKRVGNLIIGWIVSLLAAKRIRDTQCGFRALSRNAAELIRLSGIFTYTQEMILDLSFRRMRLVEVPVTVQYFKGRQSRVVRSIPQYTFKVIGLILTQVVRNFAKPLFAVVILAIIPWVFYMLLTI